jgi:hypothetical protein
MRKPKRQRNRLPAGSSEEYAGLSFFDWPRVGLSLLNSADRVRARTRVGDRWLNSDCGD